MTAKAYYDNHIACPKCGSDNICATTLGMIYEEGRPFKDTNRAACGDCKWVGVVHDLVQQEK